MEYGTVSDTLIQTAKLISFLYGTRVAGYQFSLIRKDFTMVASPVIGWTFLISI